MSERLFGSPYLSILPQGFREAPPIEGIAYETWNDVLASFLTWGHLTTALSTWEDLMVGHPGHEGGVPRRPSGTGVEWGVAVNGVEWWLTDADGLEGSALWEPRREEPAVGDGTWLLDVRAPGRAVTVTGVLLSENPADLAHSVAVAGATLATKPRTGWLTWETPDSHVKRLPVALSGQTKIKRVGKWRADVEMNLLGIDIGSAGAGAYLEAEDVESWIPDSDGIPETITVPGMVPTPPTVILQGPMAAGATVTIDEYVLTTTAPILAAQTVIVDCRQRLVSVNGTLDRSLITLEAGRWPLLQVGPVDVACDYSPISVDLGSIIIQAWGLW